MTDINPLWRIKTLTEQFGPCGFGWKYEIVSKEIHPAANGEFVSVVDINLYVLMDGQWSAPIPGTGGSMLVKLERKSPTTSDECFKMALTDAISVSCKSLGVGADIYWDKDPTKYTSTDTEEYVCCICGKKIGESTYKRSMENTGKAYCSKACLDKGEATNG